MNDKPQRYALVGMKHRGAEVFVAALPPDAPLLLLREPQNKYDANAVQVWAKDGQEWRHVGYISKDQNAVLARFIDSRGVQTALPQRPEIAKDGAMPSDAVIDTQAAVGARLHKGNNKWPLVELA